MSGSGESSRKGKGRQKVEMVKIENETNLQVTFSKRRAGLFKKASELSTLCGAETAVVVFSPGNKAHCFGHPNVDVVANRFLNRDDVAPMSDADKLVEAHQQVTVNQQNLELAQIEKQLELEQKRSRELEKERKKLSHRPDIGKLNLRQLGELKGALVQLRQQVQDKVGTTSSNANSARLMLENPVHHGAMIPYNHNEFGPIIPYSSATSSNDH